MTRQVGAMPPLAERFVLLAATALGMRWAVETTDFNRTQWWTVALLVGGAAVALAVLRGIATAPWLVLGQVTLTAVAERLWREPFAGSDVLRLTQEGIAVLRAGGNPYAHFYITTIPPGSPFAYPPGELLFYAIPDALFGGIGEVDRWAGIGVALLLAALAPVVGPVRASLAAALWASFGLAAYRAVDGSNDTSLAFLVVLGVVLLAWAEAGRGGRGLFLASAVAFGWAVAFKQLAWFVYPFVVAHLWRRRADWRRFALVSLGLAAAMTLPFLLWSPLDFLRNLASAVTLHQNVWGMNVWAALRSLAPSVVDAVSPFIPVVTFGGLAFAAALLLLRPARDLGRALLQGAALLLVAFLLARWTTSPYYVFAGAVVAAALALIDLDGDAASLRR